MTDVLSRVQILLDADTARFEQRMNAAPAVATRNFDKIKASAKLMATVVASAALASAGAVVNSVDQQVKSINELERFAYIAQSTVPEFQKLAVGAQMFGIEQDKLADITKDFNEKLGEMATVGGGGALDFIEQVGIKTEGSAEGAMKLLHQLSELSGPDGMALYVKKMQEANLSQDQMSFLMESMASDSTMLLPLLKNNAEGMKLWGDAAEDAGIIFDEKTIKSAKEMQVQTKLLDMQMQGFKNQLTSSLFPALVDIGEGFSNGGDKATGMADAGAVLADILRGVASVGLGVYATVNMIANSMAGVTKSAMDSYKLADKAANNGSWFDKLPSVKFLKAGVNFAVTANADNSGIGMAMEDNRKVIESLSESMNNMWDGELQEANRKLAELKLQAEKTTNAATKGTQDWLDKQNEVNEANQKAIQAQKEMDQLLKEQARARQEISYQYADRLKQIQMDLDSEIDRIESAKFSRTDQDGLVAAAIFRAQSERDLYIAEQQFEINAHRFTEEQKLAEEFKINQLRIKATADLHEDMKQASLIASNERYQQEMAWIRLEKAQAESDAGSMLRTDLQNMEIKYAFERDQILLNSKLSEDEQKRRTALSLASEELEKRRNLSDATSNWGGTFADLTGTGDQYRLEQDRFSRYDESQGLFDAQMALAQSASEREAIWQAHNDRMILIDQNYEKSKASLGVKSASDTLSGMSDLMGALLGEQTLGYKAMFLASKGFAFAKVIMNAPETFSNVYNSVSAIPLIGPYIAPVMAGGALAIQLAQAAKIKSMNLTGMAHEGIDYVPKEGTWLLDKGERVLSPRQNADFTRYFNDQKRGDGGGVNVNINVPVGYTANESRDSNGNVTIDVVRREISDSWNNLNRANSQESRALQNNFSVPRNR